MKVWPAPPRTDGRRDRFAVQAIIDFRNEAGLVFSMNGMAGARTYYGAVGYIDFYGGKRLANAYEVHMLTPTDCLIVQLHNWLWYVTSIHGAKQYMHTHHQPDMEDFA